MPAICRLSQEVASQIAAGEVVERPASILKELLENSLDAGAAKIQVESSGAGRKLLRVADDGEGMDPEDCRLAFERHATSKIRGIEDLARLSTFGFRGEALYSIAAVSKVLLTSSARGSKKGWAVEIAGGKLKGEHEAPPIPGTTLEARDLFFNTPARAKFLKSEAVEKSHLTRTIEESALANPGIAFSYKSEGRASLRFGPAKTLTSRIQEVLGEEIGNRLLSAAEARPGLEVQAFLASPENLSAARSLQFLFINRRPVTSRLLQQALYRAYEPFRPRGRHPAAVVYLELAPDQFDVNVHPAKREVRFLSERSLFEALTGIFSSAILRAKGIPTLDRAVVRTRFQPPAPATYADRLPAPYNRFIANDALPRPDVPAAMEPPSQELGFSWTAPAGISTRQAPKWYTPPFNYLGQIEMAYLVFEANGGILLVDQHAAQERILFERLQSQVESGKPESQSLMLPVPIQLPASQVQQILARRQSLKRIGFEVEAFGKTTLHVTAAPAAFSKSEDLEEIVQRLLETLRSEGAAARETRYQLSATIACKAAVKAHDRLSGPEALRLLEDLRKCEDGTACPHGRPSMLSLTRDELARRFKRPGAPPL